MNIIYLEKNQKRIRVRIRVKYPLVTVNVRLTSFKKYFKNMVYHLSLKNDKTSKCSAQVVITPLLNLSFRFLCGTHGRVNQL